MDYSGDNWWFPYHSHCNVSKTIMIFTEICRKQTNDGSLSKPGRRRLPCHNFSNGRFRQTYIFLLKPSPIIAMPCQTLSNVFSFYQTKLKFCQYYVCKSVWTNAVLWVKELNCLTVLNAWVRCAFGNVSHKHIKMKKLYSSDTNMICNICKHFGQTIISREDF